MLNPRAAEQAIKNAYPTIKRIVDYVLYRDAYLCRVEFNSEGEEEYDPFFLVAWSSGQVSEFSIMTDGDISEIAELFATAKKEL